MTVRVSTASRLGRRPSVASIAVATIAFAAIGVGPQAVAKSTTDAAQPVRSCASLADVAIENVTINSITEHPGDATTPASCRITAISTHPPAGDEVRIWVYLPLENWNGRFQGTGGGGFSGGSEGALVGPLRQGFAAAATDTGHTGGSGSFALNEDGSLNWTLIQDNAYLGIHEAAVVGQTLTAEFYGEPAEYRYFNGCSTGGRQGLMEAQRYPDDYDGVLAGAPAINWQKLHIAQLWGQLVMLKLGNPVDQCKFQAVNQAAIAACDDLDGVVDGVIGDPNRCDFDPETLVGAVTPCGAFTATDAEVVRKIWQGPQTSDGEFMWYGLEPGAAFNGLNNTGGDPLAGQPFFITLQWIWYFITQNPEWDWTTLTQDLFERLWSQSLEQYGAVIGTDNPDLSSFAERGGKILMWHGWNDQLIYPMGTVDYYTKVVDTAGGTSKSDKHIRLYMAPGVAHCAGGPGPQPSGMFQALMEWVENGKEPKDLLAVRTEGGEVVQTRPLCEYPLVARYRGHGSTDDASSFQCKMDY